MELPQRFSKKTNIPWGSSMKLYHYHKELPQKLKKKTRSLKGILNNISKHTSEEIPKEIDE